MEDHIQERSGRVYLREEKKEYVSYSRIRQFRNFVWLLPEPEYILVRTEIHWLLEAFRLFNSQIASVGRTSQVSKDGRKQRS